MKWQPTASKSFAGSNSGFTLAEVLAALLFMAIVIPVALQGLRVASQAGLLAERKAIAVRIAQSVLAENTGYSGILQSSQSGAVREKQVSYEWRILTGTSDLGSLREMTVEVSFPVQDREHLVRLTTLSNDL